MTLAAGENPLRLARRSLNLFLSPGSGLLSLIPDLADNAICLRFDALKVLRAAAEKLVFSCTGAAGGGPALSSISADVVYLLECLSCATFNSLASISEASKIGAVPHIKHVLTLFSSNTF